MRENRAFCIDTPPDIMGVLSCQKYFLTKLFVLFLIFLKKYIGKMFLKIGFFAFDFILLFRENELVNKKEIDVKKRYIRRKYVQSVH